MNEAQRRAIYHKEGPARILAGPGSGKTFVIINRLKYLLQELKIEPSSVLVITFTKAAAEEMRQRFLKDTQEKGPGSVHFGTFHAVFYYILKQSKSDFSYQIISESDKINLLKQSKILFQKTFPDISMPLEEELIKQIGRFKNSGENYECIKDSLVDKEVFLWWYSEYNKLLKQEEKMDFDDLAKQCISLFKKNPGVLNFWQEYFKYILIDEFQDINEPQYEVIKLLAGKRRNLFVVGDDDQSIYGFRGAGTGIMRKFANDYPDCECILLNVNYRSRKEIIKTAELCIKDNTMRLDKQFHAARLEEDDDIVRVLPFENRKQEKEYLIQRIVNWRDMGKSIEDIAIITRTNFELEEMALLLEEAGLPFYKKEKQKSLFEHPIMKDFEAYMRIASGEKNRELLLRIINHPARYIGRNFFTKEEMGLRELKEACINAPQKYLKLEQMENDCSRIAKMRPYLAINYIRKGIGYDEYLKELAGNSKEELCKLRELADFFQESSLDYKTGAEWLKAVGKHKNEYEVSKENKRKGVNLLTMHGAKGLEFSYVIIPDANEGVIPRGRKLIKSQEEEERRIFYVGITRAKDYLDIYYVNGENERKRLPSRFIKNLIKRQP